MARILLGLVLAWLMGCRAKSPAPPSCDAAPSNVAEALQLENQFESDAAFRRTCLEKSLVNPHNGYSKTRLSRYTEQAWGSLPVAAFKVRPVVPSDLGHPVPSPDANWTTVPGGAFPATGDGLLQRGVQMFARFPAQVERSMLPILRDKQAPSRYGLWQTSDSVGGLVWVALPGGVFPALTCSSCHSSVDESGALREGVPNHRLDLGKAKDDYMGMRTLYSTWGPGRVDIAADGFDNPVVIADIRPVRFETHLHRTANVRNSLTALTLRVETGLVLAHYEAVRPHPRDAFALAYYLWSLGEKLNLETPQRHPGQPAFAKHCASCHQGTSLAGPPVPAASMSSPVANMPSAARGTGSLNAVSLLGVSARQRLLYGGEASGPEQLLDPARKQGGHYMGSDLDDAERRAILAYLDAL